jgi:autoinducer 2-degrading protein
MSKEAFIIIVDLEATEEHQSDIDKYLCFTAVESMKEEGCTVFDVSIDPENNKHFFLYEVYKNEAAFEFHKTTEHFKQWVQWNEKGAVKVNSVKKLKGHHMNFI